MENPRCSYRHSGFYGPYNSNSFSAFTIGNRHDGSRQCWMEGKHVGNFGTEEEPEYFCIFHAPEKIEPPLGFSKADREYIQPRVLKELLTQWNEVNEKLEGNQRLTFALPGMQRFEASLQNFHFSHNLIFDDATFKGYASFRNATFKGYASFKNATFNGITSFEKATFSDLAEFRNATFKGYAMFDHSKFNVDAVFSNSTFSGDASFKNATFSGAAWFHNSTFSGTAWFKNATFKGHAVFDHSTFSGDARFIEATFRHQTMFNNAVFSGEARFDVATFSDIAKFYDSTFRGDVRFDDAVFESSAWFNSAEFNGRAYFNNSSFEQYFLLQANSFHKGCWFTKSKFGNLKYSVHLGEKILFNDCSGAFTFADQDCAKLSFLNMDMSNADFLGADIKNTRFEACRWEKTKWPPYSIVYQHKKIVDEYKKSRNSDDESVKKEAEDGIIKLRSHYLQLKKNLEEGHYYRQAGEFHYREMEIREMLEKRGLDRFMLWLYRELADFGENWFKLGICLFLSFPLFAGFVFGCEWLVGHSSLTYRQAFEDVFLAVVPSVFRKCADFSNLLLVSKLIIMFETVTALILAALFAMAVRRRFRR